MKLVEEDKISLDDPVDKFLDNDELMGKNISILDLLNHTSGISTISNAKNHISFLNNCNFEYSNANYNILGYIIQNITGLSYEEYLENSVFLPLAMNNSFLNVDSAEKHGLATGYRNFFGINIPYKNSSWSDRSWIQAPSGYTIASTDDMVKYLQMYLNNGTYGTKQLLTKESIDTVLNNGVFTKNNPATSGFFTDEAIYSLGWISKIVASKTVYYHIGKLPHYTTMMVLIPELDTGFIILCNNGDFLVSTSMIEQTGVGLTNLLLGNPVSLSSPREYWIKHMWLNSLLLLATAYIIFIFFYTYQTKVINISLNIGYILKSFLLFAIPIATLSILPAMTGTPLLEMIKFVPDIMLTIAFNSALMFSIGILKIIKLCRIHFYHKAS